MNYVDEVGFQLLHQPLKESMMLRYSLLTLTNCYVKLYMRL